MRTTDFDRIASSAPLDATAAVVRDGTGEAWTPRVTYLAQRWDICPELRPVPNDPSIIDLTGTQVGRLKVVGLWGQSHRSATGKQYPAKWVVRCSCGWFEARKGASLKSLAARGVDEGCAECNYIQHLNYRSRHPLKGKDEAARLDDLAARSRRPPTPKQDANGQQG